MPRIVVTDATFPRLDQERAVAARFGGALEEARCTSDADVMEAAKGTDVLIVQFARITRKVIELLAPNAAIVRYGIGLDNIDLVAAKERDVKVTYVPDYATGEVADHTVALALAALRKLFPLDRSLRAGAWDAVGTAKPLKSFQESVVGFLGFGRIGREVHARLQPFGFSSIVCDPYADKDTLASLRADAVDLDTLFSTADLITLHAPLTGATRHIVNAHRLSQMKPTSVVVNTARGALVDAEALCEALTINRIAGAALDVFDEEPLPGESPLRKCPNLILTPHAAWYSTRSAERLQALAADEVERHLSGRPPRCLAPLPV